MLEIEKATTTLGQLNFEFSLSVASDETVVILGQSGAGKSTLLNLVNGFVNIESGEVRWNGELLNQLSVHKRPVTTLFQKNNLFDHLTARKNIGLGLDPGLKLNSNMWRSVDEAMDRMGLAEKGDRLPAQLSGGEQQRVALARALIMNRPILLLDEPYSALDMETRQSVLEITRELCTEKALCTLVVTHNPHDAEILDCRTVEVANNGVSLDQFNPEQPIYK